MMTFKEFSNELVLSVKEELWSRGLEPYNVWKDDVPCALGSQTRLMIKMKENDNVSPSLPLDMLYDDYRKHTFFEDDAFEHLVNSICDSFVESLQRYPDENMISDIRKYDPGKLFLRLVRDDKAGIDEIVHENIGSGLAVVPALRLSQEMTANVPHELCELYKVSEKEIIKAARENMLKIKPPVISSLAEQVSKARGIPLEIVQDGMPEIGLLSCEDGMLGSAYVTDKEVMKQVTDRFGDKLIILPSSVHEVLILPEKDLNGMDIEDLQDMISAVNMTMDANKDVLTDQPYYYDGAAQTLELYSEHLEREKNGIGKVQDAVDHWYEKELPEILKDDPRLSNVPTDIYLVNPDYEYGRDGYDTFNDFETVDVRDLNEEELKLNISPDYFRSRDVKSAAISELCDSANKAGINAKDIPAFCKKWLNEFLDNDANAGHYTLKDMIQEDFDNWGCATITGENDIDLTEYSSHARIAVNDDNIREFINSYESPARGNVGDGEFGSH